MTKRVMQYPTALAYPTNRQLSLVGLAADDPESAYIADLAVRRLRRLAKTFSSNEIPWGEATRIADPDLLKTLHVWGRIKCAREAWPWVVYVIT